MKEETIASLNSNALEKDLTAVCTLVTQQRSPHRNHGEVIRALEITETQKRSAFDDWIINFYERAFAGWTSPDNVAGYPKYKLLIYTHHVRTARRFRDSQIQERLKRKMQQFLPISWLLAARWSW